MDEPGFLEWQPQGDEDTDYLCSDTQADPGYSSLSFVGPRRSASVHRLVMTILSFFLPGEVDPQPPQELYPIYVVLAGVALLAFCGVGMVATRKRRHEHGRLWLPEGFKTSETSKKKRREPVGEDSVGLK